MHPRIVEGTSSGTAGLFEILTAPFSLFSSKMKTPGTPGKCPEYGPFFQMAQKETSSLNMEAFCTKSQGGKGDNKAGVLLHVE